MPAAIAHSVLQRGSAGDRGAPRLKVRPDIEKCFGDLDVVTARRPVQRQFVGGIAVSVTFGSAPASTSRWTICGPSGSTPANP